MPAVLVQGQQRVPHRLGLGQPLLAARAALALGAHLRRGRHALGGAALLLAAAVVLPRRAAAARRRGRDGAGPLVAQLAGLPGRRLRRRRRLLGHGHGQRGGRGRDGGQRSGGGAAAQAADGCGEPGAVHQWNQSGRHGVRPARVGALPVELGRLLGLGEAVGHQDAVHLPSAAVLGAQAGRRPLGGQRVALQGLRRGPRRRLRRRRGVTELLLLRQELLGGERRLLGVRRRRGPALGEAAVRPLQLPRRVDDELHAVGALVVDAAPADGLGEVPDHGPGHAGQVAQVARLPAGSSRHRRRRHVPAPGQRRAPPAPAPAAASSAPRHRRADGAARAPRDRRRGPLPLAFFFRAPERGAGTAPASRAAPGAAAAAPLAVSAGGAHSAAGTRIFAARLAQGCGRCRPHGSPARWLLRGGAGRRGPARRGGRGGDCRGGRGRGRGWRRRRAVPCSSRHRRLCAPPPRFFDSAAAPARWAPPPQRRRRRAPGPGSARAPGPAPGVSPATGGAKRRPRGAPCQAGGLERSGAGAGPRLPLGTGEVTARGAF